MLPLHYANLYRQYQTYVRKYGEQSDLEDRVRRERRRLRVDRGAHGARGRPHGRPEPALLHAADRRVGREGRGHRVRRPGLARDDPPHPLHGRAAHPARRDHGPPRSGPARLAHRRRVGHLVRRRARHRDRIPVPAEHDPRRGRRGDQPAHLPQARLARAHGEHRADGQRAAGDAAHRRPPAREDPDVPRVRPVLRSPGRGMGGCRSRRRRPVPRLDGLAQGRRVHDRSREHGPRAGGLGVASPAFRDRGRRVSARLLVGETSDAHNTFDAPDAVAPVVFDGYRVEGDTLTVTLPPRAVASLRVTVAA